MAEASKGGVGPILRMSDDIDGIIQAIRDDNPDQEVRVIDRHAYVRIEGDPPLLLTRASIEAELGRDFPLRELELLMSSFSGVMDSSQSDRFIWGRKNKNVDA
ncbi:MAG: MmoB/DmpM family protein [Sporichthyaceae bacterium]